MIEILSAQKVKIDTDDKRERFLVCEKRDNGGLLIMGLSKYLKIGCRGSGDRKAAAGNNRKRKRGG